MPSWIALALLSAVFAACVPIFAKRGLVGVDSTTATALRSIVMAVFLAALVTVRGGWAGAAAGELRDLGWILGSGIAGALSWLCYFAALNDGPATGVVALDRTSVIFAVILAALFLSEQLTLRSGAGAVLITVGAILMAWR